MSFLAKPGSFTNKAKVAFNPRNLFRNGEQGFIYDYQDWSTLYQDSVGTTPVSAVERPVGLVLDKSQGLALGSELVTNGDFSSGTTGWADSNGTLSVVSGALQISAQSASPSNATQTINGLVVGNWYKVTATYWQAGTGGTAARVSFFGATTPNNSTSTPVTASIIVQATATSATLSLASFGTAATLSYFDNISVKLLPGNHASQSTSASRPVLSARVNLLTYSEQFDNAAWVKSNSTVTANAATAPDGTLTADKLIESAAVNRGRVGQSIAAVVGQILSVCAKAAEWNRVCLGITNNSGLWSVYNFNLSNGTYGARIDYSTSRVGSPTMTALGNGWYRCSVSVNAASGAEIPTIMPFNQDGDPINPSPALTGDGTSGIYIWGADLRYSNVGVNLPAYQRIADAATYDTAGFPYYLKSDGVDDFMVTNTITPGVDKVQVFAGVRKLSDAAIGVVAEFSANSGSNSGAFYLSAPDAANIAAQRYAFLSRGNAALVAAQSSRVSDGAAPDTAVLTGLGDISGDSTIARRNGVAYAAGTGDQGTGNFGSYPCYLFMRGGTALPANVQCYGLVCRFGPNLSAAQIAQMETWMNARTKAY